MSKWDLEKIKNRVKFGDFVSIDDDFNEGVFIKTDGRCFITVSKDGERLYRWHIDNEHYKFFNRQGKEILPEAEYEYVNFDSFGELCESIVKGETIFDACGDEIPLDLKMRTLYEINRLKNAKFKRVEV